MESNSPDSGQVGQNPGEQEVGEQPEKTPKHPEQVKQELIDAVLEQNEQLEGQFLTEVDLGASAGGEKIYIFNAFPYNRANQVRLVAGVSSKDGPIIYNIDNSNKLGRTQYESGLIDRKVVSSGKVPVNLDLMHDWQQTVKIAKENATRRAELIKRETEVFPKALDFVKSLTSQTEPGTQFGAAHVMSDDAALMAKEVADKVSLEDKDTLGHSRNP